MTKESLDSDRVNYMIWRGLVYTAIDRELAEVTAEGDAVAVTGFFGPLTPTSSTSAAPADDEDFENVRKRQIDNEQPAMSNGPPPKRPRLSNGYENGFDANAMEVDEEQNGDEHAYPSPEQLPSPVVATVGPEQGTQIDKVNELSTETVFLELSDDQASRNAVLLQCEWNPRDPKILAAAGTDALARMWTLEHKGGTETVVTIMSPTNDEAIKYILPQHNLHEQVLDAVWTSNEEFVISGGDLLQGLHCVESVISPSRKFETREGHSIAKITYDWRSELLATASETGTIDIWDPTGRCQSFDAHQGNITALAWQPLPFPVAVGEESERLLVSSGEDGAISMWNARSTDSKPRSMTMGSAVVSLAFTPDGAFLAAGTTDRIFIWKVDDPVAPKASWLRSDQSGWRTPMSQDSAGDENQYSLSWDAHGQKLAYGAGNSLAIINFRR
ncbi:putative F-box-like/WD repeat-containing protein TBL1X [Glarea lozoyensis 74030]|uniref:Putative F-box-like/WD repeat-containing protein TBL1X n=1 Tax=Glarea lozoyensis (strain ATCC 74030 / MF5533) TaxID=1104152 RepID=H0ETI4_GLAL7|nr:putative F-box-like/WD repeat-containing protein TBL1X [Glarea lozoyensis 74030]